MTVRAVDMQTMIPRLNEASKLQHQTDLQPQVAQHSQTAAMQARAERAQHQVSQKAPADHVALHADGGGHGAGGEAQQQGQKKKPAAKAEPAKGQPVEPGLGQRLDVKL